MRRISRKTWVILVVSAVVFVAVACAPPPGTVHGLVGDSISWNMENQGGVLGFRYIDASRGRTAFHGGFSGEPGNGIEGVQRVASSVPARAWVVIEIGTNDVTNNPADYHYRVQALLNATPKDRCVAFVTVRRRDLVARSDIWNAIVRQRIADHPCRAIIDWDTALRGDPSLLSSDGIHPSSKGYGWLRLVMVATSRLPWGAH